MSTIIKSDMARLNVNMLLLVRMRFRRIMAEQTTKLPIDPTRKTLMNMSLKTQRNGSGSRKLPSFSDKVLFVKLFDVFILEGSFGVLSRLSFAMIFCICCCLLCFLFVRFKAEMLMTFSSLSAKRL